MAPEDRHSGLPGGNGSGANVKSGRIENVSDDASGSITFNTAFVSVPRVSLQLETIGGWGDDSVFVLSTPTTTGFNWRTFKGHGGGGHTYDIDWIATDAGDP